MAKVYNTDRLDNGLFYTDEEILKMYNDAKDKREQIHILRELNLCTEDEIKQALIRAGLNKCENGLSYTDSELLEMYNANKGDKGKYINELAEMNQCSDDDIKKALLRAGLDFRSLPRKRRNDGHPITVKPPVIETKCAEEPESSEPVHIVGSSMSSNNDSVIENTPVETATQTRLLQVIQNSIHAYQDVLNTKKTDLEMQIQDLEHQLDSLKKELQSCNDELTLSKSIFQ